MSVVRSLEQRVVILIATGVALTSILLGAIGVVAYRRQQAHLDASHAAIVHSMTARGSPSQPGTTASATRSSNAPTTNTITPRAT